MRVAASAPGRCGIVGNPSDIYGGFLVSCSVPLRNRCLLDTAPPHSTPDDPTLWNAATSRLPVGPARVEWTCDVPRSSGLAGSTALLAATMACLSRVRGDALALESFESRSQFAEFVRDVELNEAGVVCGFQDAYMAVHGGLVEIDFEGKHPIHGGPLGRVAPLDTELPFLLITTGVERLSGSVHGPMRERWLSGDPEVVQGMARIAELGRAGARALRSRDWNGLAVAMRENHAIVASLGGSGEPIDRLVEGCLRHGALAAKLAGAGLGGTVIALTENPEDLRQRLTEEGYGRFLRPSVEPGLRFEATDP